MTQQDLVNPDEVWTNVPPTEALLASNPSFSDMSDVKLFPPHLERTYWCTHTHCQSSACVSQTEYVVGHCALPSSAYLRNVFALVSEVE